MTWSARVVMADGTLPSGAIWNACEKCKHGQRVDGRGFRPNCSITGMVSPIANALTAVDFGADNHMACGNADLKCSGFESVSE